MTAIPFSKGIIIPTPALNIIRCKWRILPISLSPLKKIKMGKTLSWKDHVKLHLPVRPFLCTLVQGEGRNRCKSSWLFNSISRKRHYFYVARVFKPGQHCNVGSWKGITWCNRNTLPPNYTVGITAKHPDHSKHSKSLLEQHTFCVSKAASVQNSAQIKELMTLRKGKGFIRLPLYQTKTIWDIQTTKIITPKGGKQH